MAKCGEKTEVYSRVCGYFRPVSNWNKGKKEEFKDRKLFEVAGKVIPALALVALLLSGCLTPTASTIREYDQNGKLVRETETTESVISTITKSTAEKTVVAWESGWAAYLTATTATVENPVPALKLYAGQIERGTVSARADCKAEELAKLVRAARPELKVSSGGVEGK